MKIFRPEYVRLLHAARRSLVYRLSAPFKPVFGFARRVLARVSQGLAEQAGKTGLNDVAERLYLFSHAMNYRQDQEHRRPSSIAIETIMGCNAACVMCPYPTSTRKKGLMKETMFDQIVDQVAMFPEQPKVALHFLGEPLMDKTLEDRIRILKRLGIRQVEVVTNASLLTKQRAISLMEAGVDLLNVDLESLDKKIYESIRIGLDHDIVMKNIFSLFEARNEIDAKTAISILFIEQEKNKNEMEGFLSLFADYIEPEKGDYIRVFPMHNYGGFGSTDLKPSNMPCYSLYTSLNVLNDGRVALCCVDEDGEFEMGNVNENSIEEIFNASTFQRFRKLHEAGGRWVSRKCANCNVPEVAQAQRIYGAGGEPLIMKATSPVNGDALSARHCRTLSPI